MTTRRNLCANPALGVDVTGWGGGSTPTRTAVAGFDRPWAARYTVGAFATTAATDTGAVTAGDTYTVSVSIRPATFTANTAIYIEWINVGGGGFGYPNAAYSIPAGTIGRLSLTAVAPSGAVACRAIFDGINFAINTVDSTTVLIEPAPGLGIYFDGDSAGANWSGVPGLSSSTLADVVPVSGTAHLTLPALTAALAGTVKNPGRLTTTLPSLVMDATGLVAVRGVMAARLPALTAELSGQVLPSEVADRPPARLTSGSRAAVDLAGSSRPLATLQGGGET